jgi:hypothetical protein
MRCTPLSARFLIIVFAPRPPSARAPAAYAAAISSAVALSDIPDNAATAGREFGLRDSMADDKSTQRRRVACVASMVTFMATNLANEPWK